MSASSVSSAAVSGVATARENVDGWHPAGRPVRVLYICLALLFAALMIAGLVGYGSVAHPANDFFAFNSYSRFIHRFSASQIYDQALLRTFQGLPGHKVFAFMYPPTMLLLVWPLALLPYALGYVLWIGVGVAACVASLGIRRGAWPLALLVAVAPSTLWTALCGQSTLLVSALIVGGLLLSERRPILAGLLLGLATYKPQLGLLVPVALVAARQWRTVVAAMAAFAVISALSTLAFGSAIWPSWISHAHSIVDIRTQHASAWAPLLATIASDLATLGAGRQVADIGQAVASVGTALCIWFCFRRHSRIRRDGAHGLEIAGLAAATFLATPFAFIYDLPLFTMAVLLFVNERRMAAEPFHAVEILAIVMGLLVPCVFLIDGMHCAGSVVVAIVLAAILRRLHVLRARAELAMPVVAGGHAPVRA